MLLNAHILAYARCFARKVCGLLRSTWGTSQGEDKPGARDKILNGDVPCAVRTLFEKLAVFHHREFSKFRRLKGRH